MKFNESQISLSDNGYRVETLVQINREIQIIRITVNEKGWSAERTLRVASSELLDDSCDATVAPLLDSCEPLLADD